MRVDPGQNLYEATVDHPAGTTFWLSPGTHILGDSEWAQVVPKAGSTYIGAPSAVLDGRNLSHYAFTGTAENVTIRHLTIRNFDGRLDQPVVNISGATGWNVDHNTIADNAGAGLGMGTDNVVHHNCITRSGQYAMIGFTDAGARNITFDRNEVSYSNTGDWENQRPGCGCSGTSKFWAVYGAKITNNWIHNNNGSGIWADTNAVGFLIEGNWLNDNAHEAIFYETSYNAHIVNNTLVRNAIGKGRTFTDRNDGFPITAIYISESGSDPTVFPLYPTLEISGNNLVDNWGGITLWENSDRFCNTAGSTAPGQCPLEGIGTPETCVEGTISTPPYPKDCRWKTQNVQIHDNTFSIDKGVLECQAVRCGEMGLFSKPGIWPPWSPYLGNTVKDAITFDQNNRWFDNKYIGDWRFDVYDIGHVVDWFEWRAAPYNQDTGSTITGGTAINALDEDTATLEGSIGRWASWFSANATRSDEAAHGGTHSLKVEVTAAHSWGVTLSNWPGFRSIPGEKTLSFWARKGSASPLGAKMYVHWRTDAGVELRTDVVSLNNLTSDWQHAVLDVTAPPGTTKVSLDLGDPSGNPGDVIYLDDLVVISRTPPANALDDDSGGFENTLGSWVGWFSANVTRSNAEAHTGASSMKVAVTAADSWGVTQVNWPGSPATPGHKALSFWAKKASANALGVTMYVHWRDEAGNDLQVDAVPLTGLTTSWKEASKVVTAPAGTTRVSVDLRDASGVAGDVIYVDDVLVTDSSTAPVVGPPPVPNALDEDTSTIEGSTGRWAAWFTSTVSRSEAEARSGTASLKVDITGPYSWGVVLNNWPGFAATPGAKTLAFWAKSPSPGLSVSMNVTWRDASGSDLGTDVVTLNGLTSTWQQATADVTAPAGTARVSVDFRDTSGDAGSTLYLDDIVVLDA